MTIFTEITNSSFATVQSISAREYPIWDGPDFVKDAARKALGGGADQYPPSPGILDLRQAFATGYGPFLGRDLDPDSEITVTLGYTEALPASSWAASSWA